MLILLAEDEDCAEKWVEAFQGAILALNRLTTVTEADDEDRVTSAMMKTAISFRVATPSVGMEGVAGEAEGVHKQCDDVKWVKNKNKGMIKMPPTKINPYTGKEVVAKPPRMEPGGHGMNN